jgi:O-antigen/teichoic acid export membrane protein
VRARLARLSKDSLIYGLGGAAARYTGLLLLPIYTRVFRPDEYGILESIVNLSALLLAITMLGLDGAATLLYFATDNPQERRRLCTLWIGIGLGVSVPVTVLLIAGAAGVSLFATGTPRYADLFALGAAVLPFILLQTVCSIILRLTFRPRPYAVLNFSLTTLTALLSIYLVIVLRMGLAGALWGTLLGTALVSGISLWTVRDQIDLGSLREAAGATARRLLQLGLPLVPAGIALWIISFSNTYFLIQFVGSDEAGIFRVGARLAALLGLGILAFQLAWTPFSLSIAREPDAPRTYARVATLYTAGGVGAAILMAGLAPLLVQIFARGEDYGQAAAVIGLLALGAVALGAYYVVATGVNLAQRTGQIAWTTLASAAVSLALNALLIPSWGIIGAGLAGLAANLTSTVLIFAVSQRVWPLPFQTGRLLATWLIGAVCVAGAGVGYAVAQPALWLTLPITLALAGAYTLALFLGGILTPRDIRVARSSLANLVTRRANPR